MGPLTSTGSGVSVGGAVAVDGAVTLDSASTAGFDIFQAGTTPPTDYTQLTATGTVSLGSAALSLGSVGTCPILNVGDVDTLITTTGSVTGTFSDIPNGTTIPLSCNGGTPPTVRINYTSSTVTATVVTAGSSATSTTTTLSPSTTSPVTNQTVTLTATVAPGSPAPAGTVEFADNGTAISGCSSQPVAFNGSTYTATCQTSFTARLLAGISDRELRLVELGGAELLDRFAGCARCRQGLDDDETRRVQRHPRDRPERDVHGDCDAGPRGLDGTVRLGPIPGRRPADRLVLQPAADSRRFVLYGDLHTQLLGRGFAHHLRELSRR